MRPAAFALALLAALAAAGLPPQRRPALDADDTCDRDEMSVLQHFQGAKAQANMTGSTSADASMLAGLQDVAQINATQGMGPAAVATFGGGAKGFMSLLATPFGVVFGNLGLSIKASLLSEVCGSKTGDGEGSFPYHIHDFWLDNRQHWAVGSACGVDFTGDHWDPTAACGPSSGNPVCAACHKKKGLTYACSPARFNWWEANQYNPDNAHACELGDLSGMFGALKAAGRGGRRAAQLKGAWGIAQMAALKGSLYDKERCHPEMPGFLHASSSMGDLTLDKLRGKSIVVHCPGGYEHAGTRLACAKLA